MRRLDLKQHRHPRGGNREQTNLNLNEGFLGSALENHLKCCVHACKIVYFRPSTEYTCQYWRQRFIVVVNYKCAVSLPLFQHLDSSARQYLHSEDTGASCHAFFSISLGGGFHIQTLWAQVLTPKKWTQTSSFPLNSLWFCVFISKYLKLTIENKIHD